MWSWMIWLTYQVVTTAGFFVWYARKHPMEAQEMWTTWVRWLEAIRRWLGL